MAPREKAAAQQPVRFAVAEITTIAPYLSIYSERAGFVFHLPPAVFFSHYFLLFGNGGRWEVRREATFWLLLWKWGFVGDEPAAPLDKSPLTNPNDTFSAFPDQLLLCFLKARGHISPYETRIHFKKLALWLDYRVVYQTMKASISISCGCPQTYVSRFAYLSLVS